MLLACANVCLAFLLGLHGCHCPFCWMSGMRYLPWLSQMPMKIGSPLQVIKTSSSLWTVMPVLVNMDTVPSSAVLPMLMSDVGKSLNVSAHLAVGKSLSNGK